MSQSRYRPDGPSDYRHRLHAGNVGDVWKHCALAEVLRGIAAAARRIAYVESHAGEGGYDLAPTGEWTEGIGRLWSATGDDGPVGRYVALCRTLGAGVARPERYPGSPAFARRVLGPSASLALWEKDAAAIATLTTTLEGDPNAHATHGDGLAALPEAVRRAEADADAVMALVDPPYSQKSDWTGIPDVVARTAAASRQACLLVWYPVKSLTRPNAMIARLAAAGVGGAIAELITTPLTHQRNRLNGSGVLLVRPPAGTLEALGAAAPVVGRACATHGGAWSFRMQTWPDAG